MNTGFKTEKQRKERRERSKLYKEFIRQICLDRKFMSSMTDEEFCTYESERTKIPYERIKKVLVKCGYFVDKTKGNTRSPLTSLDEGISSISFQNAIKLS